MWLDLRYALRTLRAAPGFAAAAILTLAIGIGANTVMFSIVDTLLVRPFPYLHPERLVFVWTRMRSGPDRVMNSLPDFLDWRSRYQGFDDMGAWIPTTFDFRGGDYPERIQGQRATAGFFSTLGAQPELGRSFLPEEERAGGDRAILISDRFWRARFHADPHAAGSTVSLSRNAKAYEKYTIAGVLPASLQAAFPKYGDIWGAIALDGEEAHQRGMGGFNVVARLKAGVSMAQAQAALSTIEAGLATEYPATNRNKGGVELIGLHENLTGYARLELMGLMGAVGFVLLIVCLNVANLALARGANRRRELAIRAAIGAGRARLVRQLLTESVVLALAGGAAGAVLAAWGIRLARTLIPAFMPRTDQVTLDGRVLLFTAAISMLTGIACGLMPALQCSRADLQTAMQLGGEWSTPEGGALRNLLVIAEVALGLVLLTGAGLMLNSFVRLLHVDTGFDARDLLAMQTHLPSETYRRKSAEERWAVIERILTGIKEVPGVRYAAISDFRPLGNTMNSIIRKTESPGTMLPSTRETVSGDYFAAMGTRLLRGRLFSTRDTAAAPPVIVVNETAARRYWTGEEPIGHQVIVGRGKDERVCTVVGVVADVRRKSLDHPADPAFYVPQAQDPSLILDIVIRARPSMPLMEIAGAARKQIAAVDFSLATGEVTTMQAVISERLSKPRFLAVLLVVFGAIALLLTLTGVYGVMAYLVRTRAHEIGIRMALGARRWDVLAMILGRGAVLISVGLLLGIAGAVAATRVLASVLYEVKPGDPLTFCIVVSVLALVALAATYIPARRATKVDPLSALRYE